MDQPRPPTSAVSGGVIAALVGVGFLTLIALGISITGAVTNPETPATGSTAPQPVVVKPTPATELPPVKTPDVPTKSQQPTDAVDTAPDTPPPSKPVAPSPNVPTPAP